MVTACNMALAGDCAHTAYLTIGELSRRYSVSPSTLRRLVDSKALPCFLTQGGHRKVPAELAHQYFQSRMVEQAKSVPLNDDEAASCLIYCRVSDAKRSKGFTKGVDSDLTRQIERCKEYALSNYGESAPTIYAETGSGLNDERQALVRMVTAILAGKHDGAKLICTFKDRIVRFGSNLIRLIADAHNIELICIESTPTEEIEQELSQDIISILTVYSGRLYGARAAKRLSVRIEDAVLREIFSLVKSGYTPRDIAKHLKQAGKNVGECGRLITKAVIIRLIRRNRRIINDVAPNGKLNSFTRWFDKHAKFREGGRIQRREVMKGYKAWLKENPTEIPINDTNVGIWFRNKGITRKYGNGGEIIYVGVEMK